MSKKTELTPKEKEAIEALKAAIKGLPRSISFSTDPDEGRVHVWKHTGKFESEQAAVIRCAWALCY